MITLILLIFSKTLYNILLSAEMAGGGDAPDLFSLRFVRLIQLMASLSNLRKGLQHSGLLERLSRYLASDGGGVGGGGHVSTLKLYLYHLHDMFLLKLRCFEMKQMNILSPLLCLPLLCWQASIIYYLSVVYLLELICLLTLYLFESIFICSTRQPTPASWVDDTSVCSMFQ